MVSTELTGLVVNAIGNRTRGTVLIVLASVCFGTSGPLAKPVMDAGLSPQRVASTRITLAAVVLIVMVAATRPAALRVRREDWRLLLAYGLICVAGVQLLFFAAVARIPIGVAMLLEFTGPVLVALWVRFVRGTRLAGKAWLGIVLALTGLGMVAKVWQGLQLDALGLLAGIGAALGCAAYFLLGEHGLGSMHPLGLVTWGMVVGTIGVAVIAPPWMLATDVLVGATRFGPWQPPVWQLLLAVAVVSTAMAYLLSTSALRHMPAHVVSVLALVEPVVATVAAWVLLDQALSAVQVVGACVLLGGATLVQLASRRAAPDLSRTPSLIPG